MCSHPPRPVRSIIITFHRTITSNNMGIYTRLPAGIDEVDIIIAGGLFIYSSANHNSILTISPRRYRGVCRCFQTRRCRSLTVYPRGRGRAEQQGQPLDCVSTPFSNCTSSNQYCNPVLQGKCGVAVGQSRNDRPSRWCSGRRVINQLDDVQSCSTP